MPTKKDAPTPGAQGPFWVQSPRGAQFYWPFVPDGHSDTGESPFDVNGNPRPAIPAEPSTASAKAVAEGNVS